MIAPAVRRMLLATTLLFLATGFFAVAAAQLSELAGGWTTRSLWIAALGFMALAAGVGPWLWAQTVRSQRILLSVILLGSGGGLLALLPGMSYLVVLAAQAALVAIVVAEIGRQAEHRP